MTNDRVQQYQRWLNGEIFRSSAVRKQYKLVLLIVGLVFIYILAGYHADKQQRRLTDTKREVRDLKFRYLTVSAEYMQFTRQSRIGNELKNRGSQLRENTKPVILINP